MKNPITLFSLLMLVTLKLFAGGGDNTHPSSIGLQCQMSGYQSVIFHGADGEPGYILLDNKIGLEGEGVWGKRSHFDGPNVVISYWNKDFVTPGTPVSSLDVRFNTGGSKTLLAYGSYKVTMTGTINNQSVHSAGTCKVLTSFDIPIM